MAIGIFDSGIGGLTVLKALKQALPEESYIYLGDTARLPYGTKSAETIRRYLTQNIHFLIEQGVKALIVACNSASSALREDFWDGLPIYGVIEPGAKRAYELTRNRRIAILGTRATVASQTYVHALQALDPEVVSVQQACPLLVPLVEEGWESDAVTLTVLERYLKKPLSEGIDTLVLGCTHYPVLKESFQRIVGPGIRLVDSAETIAAQIRADIASGKISSGRAQGELRIWTTDMHETFVEVGLRILAPFSVHRWGHADL